MDRPGTCAVKYELVCELPDKLNFPWRPTVLFFNCKVCFLFNGPDHKVVKAHMSAILTKCTYKEYNITISESVIISIL